MHRQQDIVTARLGPHGAWLAAISLIATAGCHPNDIRGKTCSITFVPTEYRDCPTMPLEGTLVFHDEVLDRPGLAPLSEDDLALRADVTVDNARTEGVWTQDPDTDQVWLQWSNTESGQEGDFLLGVRDGGKIFGEEWDGVPLGTLELSFGSCYRQRWDAHGQCE